MNIMNTTISLTENERTVIEFFKMIEERKSSEELEKFYHPAAEQTEYPNAIVKYSTIRNLRGLKDSADRGRKAISKEEYEIKNMHSYANTVVIEAVWKGTVAVPVGNIPVGGEMTAYFAQFFEFKAGKIFRQRNYDCFEPFN